MGEGSGAVAWLPVTMNGDGKTQIVQLWSNSGRLGMIVYASTADKAQPLKNAERNYLFSAYTALLNRLGTSYEEIRLAQTASDLERDVLAERLGLDDPKRLNELLLDHQGTDAQAKALTESELERLFGLVGTTRYPLSDGITEGDAQQQIHRWNLDNVEWGLHTDEDGQIHLSLKKISDSKYQVELYRNSAQAPAGLVAKGTRASPTGPVNIVSADFPDLTGRIEIDFKADTLIGPNEPGINLLAVPRVLNWRLKQLRTLWEEQDRPANAFVVHQETPAPDNPIKQLPVIDPDIIGPDDFRYPYAGSDQPFNIWIRRRKWIDEQLAGLRGNRKSSGLESILKEVLGDPLPDFDQLEEDLTQGNDPKVIEEAKRKITDELHLTVESFTRLMAIRGKEEREEIGDEEWEEVYSILVQARKVANHSNWTSEEVGVRLGPEYFWIAIKPPKEGGWPPVPLKDQPWIDPEKIKLDELPEATAGRRARALWDERLKKLDEVRKQLKKEHKASGINTSAGLEAILEAAFIDILPTLDPAAPASVSITEALKVYNRAFQNNDPGIKEKIESNLYMTADNFDRLMRIIEKQEATGPQKVLPTSEEWDEVYLILTSVHKSNGLYAEWIKEENTYLEEKEFESGKAAYWRVAKAKLPPWRGSTESRQAWQQALRVRSRPPIIDPDLIEPVADLRYSNSGAVYELWKSRRKDWIANRLAILDDRLSVGLSTSALEGFDAMLAESLFGAAPTDQRQNLIDSFVGLEDENQKGNDITPRLEQLDLTIEAFSYLLRIRKLAEKNAPIANPEWDAVKAILVQVEKRRQFARWRDDEDEKGIILSPDFFKIPEPDPGVFPPKPAVTLENAPWRATMAARQEWQDMLQARIDQQQALLDAWQSAVSATEEEILPRLRDALVMATDAVGTTLDDKSKWITEFLLIDAKNDGCATTTRIAQAIETIQGLLFGVRTAQLTDTRPGLTLNTDDFEEEWKWIGSYATWRAAMFVFLYPENILLPSFRKHKTPAFAKLIDDLRSNRNLTPGQACEAAKAYSDYFRDVCNLEIKATCQAWTRLYKGVGCERTTAKYSDLFYMFAIARLSSRVYWSAYDPSMHPQDYAQTYWAEIPALRGQKVINVIGAVVYRDTENKKFIYLFVHLDERGKQKLGVVRYDLEEQSWIDTEPSELELPKEGKEETITFTAIVKQQDQDISPPHVVVRLPSGALFSRQLDTQGNNWEKEDWKLIVGSSLGRQFTELLAMVEAHSGGFYLIARRISGLFQYRVFGGPNDDGWWRPCGANNYKGTFRWSKPGSEEVYVIGYGYINLTEPTGQNSITYLSDLDHWLTNTSGLHLNMLAVPPGKMFDGQDYSGRGLRDFLSDKALNSREFGYEVIQEIAKLWVDEDKEEWKEWKLANELAKAVNAEPNIPEPDLPLMLWIKRVMDNEHNWPSSDSIYRQRKGSEFVFVSMTTLAEKIAPTCWDGATADSGPMMQSIFSRRSIKSFGYNIRSGLKKGVFRCRFFLNLNINNLTESDTVRVALTVSTLIQSQRATPGRV